MNQVNSRDKNQSLADLTGNKIETIVLTESERLLETYDNTTGEIEGVIEVIKDRLLVSTDAALPLVFSKLMEAKLAALKQKNDVLKNLTSYKSVDQSGKKKPNELSGLDAILAGAAAGAAIGTKINMSGSAPQLASPQDIIDVSIESQADRSLVPDTSDVDTIIRGA